MTNSSSLPPFIVQSPPRDDPQLPYPYQFDRVSILFFVVRAERARMKALCDQCFNDIPGLPIRIEPLAPVAFIQVLNYAKMYCTRAGYRELGYVTQDELIFEIPVMVRGNAMPSVGVVTPFMFVNADRSLITGRDVIGFPKLYANFRRPRDPDGAGLRVETSAPDPGRGSNTRWGMRRLLELKARRSPQAPDPRSPFTWIAQLDRARAGKLWPWGPVELYHPREGLVPVDDSIYEAVVESAGVRQHNYTLKQFRDAAEPMQACYQAVVRSTMAPRRFRRYAVVDRRIHLTANPALRIAQRFGLRQKRNVIDPIVGFRYESDFALTRVANVHVRTAAGTAPSPPTRDCVSLLESAWRQGLKTYLGMTRAWLVALDGFSKPKP